MASFLPGPLLMVTLPHGQHGSCDGYFLWRPECTTSAMRGRAVVAEEPAGRRRQQQWRRQLQRRWKGQGEGQGEGGCGGSTERTTRNLLVLEMKGTGDCRMRQGLPEDER